MGKKRARVVPPPSSKPLVVVGGLPRPTANTVAATIMRLRPDVNVVASPFGHRGPAAYGDPAIHDLLARACGFALADLAGRPIDGLPSPSRLLLAYVVEPGWERLVEAFGASAMPLPLRMPSWEYPRGRSWSEVIEVVTETVIEALEESVRSWREIRSRLEARSAKEHLLLPLRNFEGDGAPLYATVMDVLCNRADWDDVARQVSIRRFPADALPTYYRRLGQSNKHFPVDRRGLVFANALAGMHGPSRRMAGDPVPSTPALRALLESLFRLGTPVRESFQHDVQWTDDQPLDGVGLFCGVEGPVVVSGSHANLYPNDFVRPAANGRKVKGEP